MTNIAYQPNYHFINGGKQLYFEMPEYTLLALLSKRHHFYLLNKTCKITQMKLA